MLNSEPELKHHTLPEQWRKQLGISQKEAANLLGISKNTWIRWEQGKTRFDKSKLDLLWKLAEKKRPSPCDYMKNPKEFAWESFEWHVEKCDDCHRLVTYLAAVRNRDDKKRNKKVMVKEPSVEKKLGYPSPWEPRLHKSRGSRETY